jgi:predicted permease
MLDGLVSDFRLAARMLRKDLGFSAIAVATLALGIGANTAVFSLVDRVILRPLEYREPGRLFAIHEMVPRFANSAPLIPINAMHFREWRKHAKSFEDMAMIGGMTLNLTGSGEPERIPAARVSASLFRVLGVQAQAGRTFVDGEDQPGRDAVVVLSDELWRRRFGGDPGVVGRTIQLNGRAQEVVGVLPRDFQFPRLSELYAMTIAGEKPQIWKPLAIADQDLGPMGDFNYAGIARLRPGVSASQALGELNALQAEFAKTLPEKIELRAELTPLQDQITGRASGGLVLLLAAVGAVLLIACVNIANLLLARATARRREMAVRTALGAGAARLLRQALAESLVLSLSGGLLGMALAYAAIRGIVRYAPLDLPRIAEVQPDARLLVFNLAISLAAGLLFGLLPAWRFAHADPQDALRGGARGSTAGRSSGRLRALLVSVEVGLSTLCLIAGGLLLHSFVKLLRVDKGFEAERVVTVDLGLPASRYPNLDKRQAFIRELVSQVSAIPGVAAAGVSNLLPLGGEGGNNLVAPEGRNLPTMERPLADIRTVNPDYLAVMGIPVRSGRMFRESDRGHPVALVSTLTAQRIWPGEDPIGKRFRIGDDKSDLIEIVGVAGDVRGVSLNRTPSFTIYMPYWQRFYGTVSLVARTAGERVALGSSLRAAIRRIDPELPVPALRTMDDVVAASVAPRRFQMTLVLLFAAAALLLASLGIYGVVAYSVGQRSAEMGIRMALGAAPASIRRMVLRQGLMPVAGGLAAGVIGALVLGRLLASLLFGVQTADPLTLLAVVSLLTVVAAAATYIPAVRATRVDPAGALRQE